MWDFVEQRNDDYYIICPKCEEFTAIYERCEMPWEIDDEEVFICQKCGNRFRIVPEYKFKGFKYEEI